MIKPEYGIIPRYPDTTGLPELTAVYPNFLGTYGEVDYKIIYRENGNTYYLVAKITFPGCEPQDVYFSDTDFYSRYKAHTSNPRKVYRYWWMEGFIGMPYRLETPKEHFNRFHQIVINTIIEEIGEAVDHKKNFASMYP